MKWTKWNKDKVLNQASKGTTLFRWLIHRLLELENHTSTTWKQLKTLTAMMFSFLSLTTLCFVSCLILSNWLSTLETLLRTQWPFTMLKGRTLYRGFSILKIKSLISKLTWRRSQCSSKNYRNTTKTISNSKSCSNLWLIESLMTTILLKEPSQE